MPRVRSSNVSQRTVHPAAVVAAVVGVLAVVCLVTLRPFGGDDQPTATTVPDAAVTSEELVYLALGDSLSRGVQPDPPAVTLERGYPRLLRDRLQARAGRPVMLVEAGCGGATTESFVDGGKDCPPDAPVPYFNADAETSQLAWAEDQLRRRGDRPTLVTLSLGANDVLACASDDPDRVRACVDDGRDGFIERLDAIATRLAAAAGQRTVLAVATIYDPLLGAARLGAIPLEAAAVFHSGVVDGVNPAIREHFAKAGWEVADLGRALHERAPLESTSSPTIDEVCRITWACTPPGDIHLNDAGYARSATLHERAVDRPLRAVGVALDR